MLPILPNAVAAVAGLSPAALAASGASLSALAQLSAMMAEAGGNNFIGIASRDDAQFQDSTFSTAVASAGDPTGGVVNLAQLGDDTLSEYLAGQSELGATSEIDVVAGDGEAVDGDSIRASKPASTNGSIQYNVSPGWYRLTGDLVAYDGASAGISSILVRVRDQFTQRVLFNSAGAIDSIVYISTGFLVFLCDTTTTGFRIDNVSIKALPGPHAIQATTADKPLWQSTYWDFDGTDDFLTLAFNGGAGPADCTVLLGVETSDGTAILWSREGSGTYGPAHQTANGVTDLTGFATNPSVWVDGAEYQDGVNTRGDLAAAIANSSAHRVEVRNVDQTGFHGIRFSGHPSWFYDGKIFCIIILDNTALAAADASYPAAALALAQQLTDTYSGIS